MGLRFGPQPSLVFRRCPLIFSSSQLLYNSWCRDSILMEACAGLLFHIKASSFEFIIYTKHDVKSAKFCWTAQCNFVFAKRGARGCSLAEAWDFESCWNPFYHSTYLKLAKNQSCMYGYCYILYLRCAFSDLDLLWFKSFPVLQQFIDSCTYRTS